MTGLREEISLFLQFRLSGSQTERTRGEDALSLVQQLEAARTRGLHSIAPEEALRFSLTIPYRLFPRASS